VTAYLAFWDEARVDEGPSPEDSEPDPWTYLKACIAKLGGADD
jgi:hypothetical protein